ncbi:MAG: SH3 domain-containing protein [Arcobacter sp.]|uniref:SH3 domain-containing protein n=1 Tax=Arcobacter sp. TaxID=1872629 RepID=UPI00258E4DA9|nr:SH3 domain-containing protein [Arcobacter sp.]MDD3007461.1 SH3 domain-containing protein [Arcobacter sp.]
MKKISLILLGFVTVINLYAEEQNLQNMDKLDALDQQSKEFFKAITGLEKDYLEEQVNAIKNKKVEQNINPNIPNQPQVIIKEEPKLSQEDYEKNVFTHQNEMARLTTDFTRTKKLKDLKIKSMYSFNGKDFVVLELIDETATSKQNGLTKTELSANIEGRYVEGDNILGHKIIDINTRTKSIELYKKLDEEYGYTIYLSNYGISVSDLKKIEVNEEIKKDEKENKSVKKVFEQVKTEQKTTNNKDKSCYIVNKQNLNVRNNTSSDAKILRILKLDDKFTIKEKNNDWLQIDTIYKKVSGDVMDVSNQNNWVQLAEENVSLSDNCK